MVDFEINYVWGSCKYQAVTTNFANSVNNMNSKVKKLGIRIQTQEYSCYFKIDFYPLSRDSSYDPLASMSLMVDIKPLTTSLRLYIDLTRSIFMLSHIIVLSNGLRNPQKGDLQWEQWRNIIKKLYCISNCSQIMVMNYIQA